MLFNKFFQFKTAVVACNGNFHLVYFLLCVPACRAGLLNRPAGYAHRFGGQQSPLRRSDPWPLLYSAARTASHRHCEPQSLRATVTESLRFHTLFKIIARTSHIYFYSTSLMLYPADLNILFITASPTPSSFSAAASITSTPLLSKALSSEKNL